MPLDLFALNSETPTPALPLRSYFDKKCTDFLESIVICSDWCLKWLDITESSRQSFEFGVIKEFLLVGRGTYPIEFDSFFGY